MSLRVAVVGAGPAGIYASDLLIRNEEHDIHVDLFEQMPAPFGLIRYGVALSLIHISEPTRPY